MKFETLKNIFSKRKKNLFIAISILTLLTGILFSSSCISMSRISYEGERRISIERSSNYKDGVFENAGGNKPIMNGSRWDLSKKFFFGNQQRVPEKPLEVISVNPELITGGDTDKLRVTWLGHSSTIIEIEGKVIVTDPVFSNRPSPVFLFGPKRYHKSLPLKPEDFPEIDILIISHDHYDHLDYETINKLKNKVKRFIVPLGVGAYLEKWKVIPNRITELDWWSETSIDGIKIVAAPAQHFSGRGLLDHYETLWASWVILGQKHRVFFSGDSGYNKAFKKIGAAYGPFDITLIESGQYNTDWQRVHMLPKESIQAHIDLKGNIMIPIHWGAYNLSIHDWNEPARLILKGAEKHNISVAIPRIGGTVTKGKKLPTDKWWLRNGLGKKVAARLTEEEINN